MNLHHCTEASQASQHTSEWLQVRSRAKKKVSITLEKYLFTLDGIKSLSPNYLTQNKVKIRT